MTLSAMGEVTRETDGGAEAIFPTMITVVTLWRCCGGGWGRRRGDLDRQRYKIRTEILLKHYLTGDLSSITV